MVSSVGRDPAGLGLGLRRQRPQQAQRPGQQLVADGQRPFPEALRYYPSGGLFGQCLMRSRAPRASLAVLMGARGPATLTLFFLCLFLQSCQADLVKDNGHKYFLSVLADPYMPVRTDLICLLEGPGI